MLIEGPPGCGKTTLTKMLAVDLLARGEHVYYVQCFRIPKAAEDESLTEIAVANALGTTELHWEPSDSVLILDGLDESPFSLFSHIAKGHRSFRCVVASSRIAYSAQMRGSFFGITLAPFSSEERDRFFERWFGGNVERLRIAKGLVAEYVDIDEHTRLPLIATTTVALVESGFTPKTRAEIYDNRLELLLTKWDRARGVTRNIVENADAKRRFLRRLAFSIHSSSRRRTVDRSRIAAVFEKSLGNFGYRVSIDDVLNDLVVANGVLIKESDTLFSFGHLTFQEHLVGEYMARELSVSRVLRLVGDDWWREPLNFYASILGDITELAEQLAREENFMGQIEQLREMLRYAPYTSPGAVEVIEQTYSDVRDSLREEFSDEPSEEDDLEEPK